MITSVKKLNDNAGEMGKPKSISALRLKECEGKTEVDAPCCHAAKRGIEHVPKTRMEANLPRSMMSCCRMAPIANLIPWTAHYNQGSKH